MSRGLYFVTKGMAEALVKIGDRGAASSEGDKEEWVKGIVGAGKFFGYTRCVDKLSIGTSAVGYSRPFS